MHSEYQNWSGEVCFQPQRIVFPKNEIELFTLVKQTLAEKRKVRLVGSGHSFSPLISTSDSLVSLDHFQGLLSIDADRLEVTLKAGTKLYQMNKLLAHYGLSTENMGDVDRQSIAGALCTGTHGTGVNFGILATQICKIRLLTGQAEWLELTPKDPRFKGALVSLGALGIMTQITLKVQPAYRLSFIQRRSSVESCLKQIEKYKQTHRHFEFYYFPHTEVVQTKEVNQTSEESTPAWKHQVNELLLENLAFQTLSEVSRKVPALTLPVARFCGAVISNSYKVNASHKVFAVPRWVRFNEMEYNLPAESFEPAFRDLKAMISKEKIRVHFPIECRFVKSDQLWLSPAYQRDSAYIAIHQYKGMPYQTYFKKAEEIFLSYGGRPHWGKMHNLKGYQLQQIYPKWGDFQALRKQLDPQNIFKTDYMTQLWGLS